MVWARDAAVGAPAGRRSAVRGRRRGAVGALIVHVASACGVITGVQWAVVSQTGPGVAWAVVLGLPAFLAGATVARLLAVLRARPRPTSPGARYPSRTRGSAR